MATHTPRDTAEYNADLRFLQDPNLWPAWPFLPLKRYNATGGWPEFGYVVAVKGQLTSIRKGNMFGAKSDDPVTWVYETPEALLADGWEVD